MGILDEDVARVRDSTDLVALASEQERVGIPRYRAGRKVLDEKGKPNIGPFDCGGLVTVDSKTGEITRSGQYWAFTHFSRAMRRGARRIESSGDFEGVSHVACVNPDGSMAGTSGSRAGTASSATCISVTTLTWGMA